MTKKVKVLDFFSLILGMNKATAKAASINPEVSTSFQITAIVPAITGTNKSEAIAKTGAHVFRDSSLKIIDIDTSKRATWKKCIALGLVEKESIALQT
jgi:hypothetical protein